MALVTGGSGGIGQALVQRLTAEGAAVAVAYSAHADAAEQAAAQTAEAGARAVAVGADLRRADSAWLAPDDPRVPASVIADTLLGDLVCCRDAAPGSEHEHHFALGPVSPPE